MSRDQNDEQRNALVRELRQSYGLGASFFRAAAARVGMTDTDMQVIDLLEGMGDATAGQIAQRMGLTTGTFTAILNRLEKAGLVRRERDPNDGRRVIVRLAQGDDEQDTGSLFGALRNAWEMLAASYDAEQRALLLAFLERSNGLAQEEIARLRDASAGNAGAFGAPLAGLERGRLVVQAEGVRLTVRAGEHADALYQARFEGPVPDVKVKDGVVTIRYPRRLWLPSGEKRVAEVTLNRTIPWSVVMRGGGSEVTAELGGLDLLDVEANGAGSLFRVTLPTLTRVVPITLGGSGSEFTVKRPPGVAASVQSQGWGSSVVFDTQTVGGTHSDARLQSPNYVGATERYDIDVSGSGSMTTVGVD